LIAGSFKAGSSMEIPLYWSISADYNTK